MKIARRLCQAGFASLRFDLPGVDDSEGGIVDPHCDCFETSAASDAVEFFRKEAGVRDITLLGMCAGSRTALRTAVKDGRIDSFALISFPMTFVYANSPTARYSSKAMESRARLNVSPHRYYMSYYWKRCSELEAWVKLLTLRAHTLEIARVIVGAVWARLRRRRDTDTGDGEIVDSWRTLLSSGRRVLLVYGEHDEPLISDFKEHSEVRPGSKHAPAAPPYDLHIIEGACHTFPERAAQRRLVDEIIEWLSQAGAAQSNKASSSLVAVT